MDEDIEDRPKKKDDFMGMSWGQVGAITGILGTLLGAAALSSILKPGVDQLMGQQKAQQMAAAQAQQQALMAQQQQIAAAQAQAQQQAQQPQQAQESTDEMNLTPSPKKRVREIEDQIITEGGPSRNYVGISV